ncbi:hypothetical protein QN277_023496 [Acacia crassicarpa]|uniref:Uncharacterized protein n=1 Tax=Acacia crassicarpa TaxID=499986 RepID=A0AAE1MN30_9FABA|nr:hypothetical protein QN277_023496 [Acacia crassicarpa]
MKSLQFYAYNYSTSQSLSDLGSTCRARQFVLGNCYLCVINHDQSLRDRTLKLYLPVAPLSNPKSSRNAGMDFCSG